MINPTHVNWMTDEKVEVLNESTFTYTNPNGFKDYLKVIDYKRLIDGKVREYRKPKYVFLQCYDPFDGGKAHQIPEKALSW